MRPVPSLHPLGTIDPSKQHGKPIMKPVLSVVAPNVRFDFSLRCVRGIDQGMCATDCIDVFEIDVNAVPVMRISYDYGLDSGRDTMSIETLSEHITLDGLPKSSYGFMLGAKLIEFLNELLHKIDAEFYADCFFDADGRPISHPINKLMYGEA